MIIYGTKSKELAKETVTAKCPNCGTQNSIDLHLFQKYAHVFWIPFFPTGKTGVSQCDHCKQVLKLKEMPPVLKDAYDRLKLQAKAPVWMFSGLALVAVLVVIGIVGDRKKDQKNAVLVLSPKSGDILEIKTKANQYTLYKINAVEGDSAFVQMNNYETDKITGLDGLKQKDDSTYSHDTYAFSKAELKQMLEKGEIINIDRR